jgi:hypothetical protein
VLCCCRLLCRMMHCVAGQQGRYDHTSTASLTSSDSSACV